MGEGPAAGAPVRVRRAVPEDAPALHALIREAMRLYAEASVIPGPLESLLETEEDVRRHIREDEVLVAEYAHGSVDATSASTAAAGAEVVGTLRLSRTGSARTAYLSRFAVAPDLQRIGVGGALMHAVDQRAAERGWRRVRLHTALSNVPLVRFYRARGFRVVDEEDSRGYPRGRLEKRYPG